MTGLRGEKRTQLRQRGGIQLQQQQQQQRRGGGSHSHPTQETNEERFGGNLVVFAFLQTVEDKRVFLMLVQKGKQLYLTDAFCPAAFLGVSHEPKHACGRNLISVPKVRPEFHDTFVLGQKCLLFLNVGSKTVRRGVRSRSASCQEWKYWQQTLITL